jgi:hypothetical protein
VGPGSRNEPLAPLLGRVSPDVPHIFTSKISQIYILEREKCIAYYAMGGLPLVFVF